MKLGTPIVVEISNIAVKAMRVQFLLRVVGLYLILRLFNQGILLLNLA